VLKIGRRFRDPGVLDTWGSSCVKIAIHHVFGEIGGATNIRSEQ
jgi:hypothetical protein